MTRTIEQSVTFATRPSDLYDLYLSAPDHGAAIGSKVKISKKVGSAMSAWDGYCWGKILHLVPDTMIAQTWRASDWRRSDPDSILILLFEPHSRGSRLTMVHANVPDGHAKALAKGWKEHYWGPWKKYLASR